jgi:hypothetical protein
MPRYNRNMVVMAKVETTPGVNSNPAAATDAVLIAENVELTPLEISYAQRNLLLPYFGGSLDLVALVNRRVTFSVEASTSGTAGTAAPWSPLLRGCASAQASLTTPVRIEHTPVSANLTTLTIVINDEGVQHTMLGCVGTWTLQCQIGQTPKFQFEFIGSYVADTAVPLPTATLTAWRAPLPMRRASVTDITLGCTYAAGALTGGTPFGSSGFTLTCGNAMSFFSTLSRDGGEITDRNSTLSFELELDAGPEVTALGEVFANTTTSFGFRIGSTAGNSLIVHAPVMQRTGISKVNRDGVRMIGFEAKLVPNTGNDEWRIAQV